MAAPGLSLPAGSPGWLSSSIGSNNDAAGGDPVPHPGAAAGWHGAAGGAEGCRIPAPPVLHSGAAPCGVRCLTPDARHRAHQAVPKKSSRQRSLDRTRAATARRPVQPWAPSLQRQGAQEWLASYAPLDAKRCASSLLAAELILKQVYTATGAGGGGAVGSPSKKRTAVAAILLCHIVGEFHQYRDLVQCLLRDLFESVYIICEHDPSALWDSLCTAEGGEGGSFFSRRALELSDEYAGKPTYFDECRALRAEMTELQRKQNVLHSNRPRLREALSSVVLRRERALLRLVMRWWWVLMRLQRHMMRTSSRNHVQVQNCVTRSIQVTRRDTLRRYLYALRDCVRSTRISNMTHTLQALELKNAEYAVLKNDAQACTEKFKQCLQLWEQWSQKIVLGFTEHVGDDGSDYDDTPAPPQGHDAPKASHPTADVHSDLHLQSKKVETADSYKKRFEGLSSMVRNGIAADLASSEALPPVPSMGTMGTSGHARRQAADTFQEFTQLVKVLFEHYCLRHNRRTVVTLFDICRIINDCELQESRTAILDCAAAVAKRHTQAELAVPIEGFQEFLYEAACVTVQDTTDVVERVQKFMRYIAVSVRRFSAPTYFEGLLRMQDVLDASARVAAETIEFCKERTLSAEYVTSLELPRLSKEIADVVFATLEPAGAVHDVDYLRITLALALSHTADPFLTPAEKWLSFSQVLVIAHADVAAKQFKKLLKTPVASKQRIKRNASKHKVAPEDFIALAAKGILS